MRKKIAMCLAVVTALVLLATAVFAAGNDATAEKWDGSSKDTEWYDEEKTEFTITTAKELAGLAELVNGGNGFHGKTINLDADIDLDGKEWTPIGKVGSSFRGTFDGKEHTISNLVITKTTEAEQSNSNLGLGLFGDLGATYTDHEPTVGTLQNLTINNAKITGRGYIGAFVGGGSTSSGRQNGGNIKSCVLTGNVNIYASAGSVGGIAGYIPGENKENGANIENCTVSANPGSVIDGNGNRFVGGILGYTGSSPSSIKGCKVSGVTISGSTGVGGIVGVINQKNIIQDCSVENITVNSANDDNTAGLIAGQIYTAGSSAATLPKMYDCTADETSKVTAADAELEDPPLIGQNGKPVLVGTGIELDESGKIKSGTIELVGTPASSANFSKSDLIADGAEKDVTFKGCGFDADGNLVSYAVMVGDQGYEKLEDALAAEGDTVTLLKSISLSGPVNIAKSVTIKGAEGITVTRAANYKGTFFAVSNGATLTLDNVHIDAGGKWTQDPAKWEAAKKVSLTSTSVYNGSAWEQGLEDPITFGSGDVTTDASLITLDGSSKLVLDGKTLIENIHGGNGVHVVGWTGTAPEEKVEKQIQIKEATIQHFFGTGGSLIVANGRNTDIVLDNGAVLNDNFILSGSNGGLFYLSSGTTLTMNEGAAVTNNHGVNCNGTFFMSYGAGTTATMNGGTVSGNEGLKGGNNTYCQPIYTHSGGTFIMNNGTITGNTGCNAGAIAQNPKANTTVELNGGTITDNHYHDEGKLSGYGDVFLSGKAAVGKDVHITSEVGIYGQASVTVAEGNVIDGSVYVWSERYNGTMEDYKADLNGTITGDLYFQNNANVTNNGTVKGNVTVAEYDPGKDLHCDGPAANKGTIEGTVTLEPGTSIQLGEEKVTAGDNGAEFTVDGDNVTLLEGTLKAETADSKLNFKDGEGNTLKPTGDAHTVMIAVAEVTCGETTIDFDNLPDAVAEAKVLSEAASGDAATVKLLKDAEGGGIDISTTGNIVIDFDHHTYTLTNPPVGSGDKFKTQGLRVLAGSTVTLKNGTLAVNAENGTWDQNFIWLIHNYGNLTVENMTLDGSNLNKKGTTADTTYYTLHSECGQVTVTNTTFIDSTNTGKAYSIGCNYWDDYPAGTQITIDDKSDFTNVNLTRNDAASVYTEGHKSSVTFGEKEYYITYGTDEGPKNTEFVKDGDILTPVLPDFTLSYSALANTNIVSDCVAETMWVQFNEDLPENTWLWFEITDEAGHTWGIVGHAEKDTTRMSKMAWSFLTKTQFEMWPDDVDVIEDGTYTVTCYVLPGKVESPVETSPATKYLAWTKTVEVQSEMIPQAAPPVVEVGEKISQDDIDTVTGAANKTDIDDGHMAELTQEAMTEATAPTEEEVSEALEGKVDTDNKDVHIVVETYLDVKVTEYVTEEGSKQLTFEIKPMYQVVATTAEDVKEIKLDGDERNAVTIGEAHELTVTEPITMTLGVPDNFLGEGAVYVKHVKDNGRTYYYRASSDKDSNTITFTNPHGFSEFTVIVTAPEFKAEIGDTLYETLQDAVDHVQDGERIVVTGNCSGETVTVGRSVSFSVTVNDGAQAGTITAGSGYSMTSSVSGTITTYTVTYSGGGSASGSSTYTVKTEEVENATVEVSASSAKAGDEITVTVTTEANYHASLTVTAANGADVEVTDNKDGTFTFVMPASNVTVTATAYECPSMAFPDIDLTQWYHEYTDYAISHNLMQGTGSGFEPATTVTRAQMAYILWNLEGQPTVDAEIPFTDVPANEWYTEAIRWAASANVVSGCGDGTFRPADEITREQMAAMLYNYEQKLGTGGFAAGETFTLTFDDAASISPWAQEAVAWCTMKEVIKGDNNKFNPSGLSQRAQLATILALYDQLEK